MEAEVVSCRLNEKIYKYKIQSQEPIDKENSGTKKARRHEGGINQKNDEVPAKSNWTGDVNMRDRNS